LSVRLDGFDFDRRFRVGFRNVRKVFHLEHHVFFERILNLCAQIQNRQLQQPDSLLQLGGHRERLPELELQRRFHHAGWSSGPGEAVFAGAPRLPTGATVMISVVWCRL
jgi:hypothetical protein